VEDRAVSVEPAVLARDHLDAPFDWSSADQRFFDEPEQVGLADHLVRNPAAHLKGLDAENAGTGLVEAENRASLVHREHPFLHAREDRFVLILLPHDGLNPLIELFRHDIH
jgi:hypothetical protein